MSKGFAVSYVRRGTGALTDDRWIFRKYRFPLSHSQQMRCLGFDIHAEVGDW